MALIANQFMICFPWPTKDKYHQHGFLYTRRLARVRYPTYQDHILYTDHPECMECDAEYGTGVEDHEPSIKTITSHTKWA